VTTNQNNSIEDILIKSGKSVKSWAPWTPIAGDDSYINFSKNFLLFGVKTNNVSNVVSNITLNAWNLLSLSTISSTICDADIILGSNTFSTSNFNKRNTIISSRNATIEQNVYNTVILGGTNIQARISNTVVVPKISFENKSASDSNHNVLTNESFNSLYNLNGTLYWNGTPLVNTPVVTPNLPTPTGTYYTLYTDGVNWLENKALLNDTSIRQTRIIAPLGSSKTTFKISSNIASSLYGRVQLEYLGYDTTATSYLGLLVTDNTGNIKRFDLSDGTKYLRGDGTWQALTPINIGVLVNQTLRWSGTQWIPNSGLLSNTLQQTVIGGISGFASMDSITKLQVGGAIMLEDNGAPIPTSNKLYNNGGNLYWSGNILGSGYIGTVIGSHLLWNGSSYIEDISFLTTLSVNSSINNRFISGDGIGINTQFDFGYTGTNRGFKCIVAEPGNLTYSELYLELPYSGIPQYNLLLQDNNLLSYVQINSDTNNILLDVNNYSVINLNNNTGIQIQSADTVKVYNQNFSTTDYILIDTGLNSSLARIELSSQFAINIKTPNVNAATATIKNVLALSNATTGECEYIDINQLQGALQLQTSDPEILVLGNLKNWYYTILNSTLQLPDISAIGTYDVIEFSVFNPMGSTNVIVATGGGVITGMALGSTIIAQITLSLDQYVWVTLIGVPALNTWLIKDYNG
jgi:hypothetical protein